MGRKPNPDAVAWLESKKCPTYWARGPRPGSVQEQALVRLKSDTLTGCGRWPDFCLCVPGLPEYMHSVDYDDEDERAWLGAGLEPARMGINPKWRNTRRKHWPDWIQRYQAVIYGEGADDVLDAAPGWGY